jgi:cobaltochelatase CobS
MSDKKRLTCKECGFKSDNLIPHINEAHSSLANAEDEALVVYFIKHDCDENDVVHPDVEKEVKKSKTKATKEAAVSDDGKVKIGNTLLPKGLGGEYVPKVNAAYHFPKIANDLAMDVKENKRVLLLGHTGCGKTSIIEQVGARISQGVIRANMNGQTTIGDFVGLWTVKGGETIWVDGVLPKAMREGLWLIVDELDMAEPAILSVLNAVLEPNGKLMLKEKGHEVVVPHANFRLFATANSVGAMASYRSLYQGTNIMNEAFLDRWRCYHMEYLSEAEEIKIIINTVGGNMNETIATPIVKVANAIRQAFLKEEVACTFSLRRMLDWAELMVRYRHPMDAAKPAIFTKVSKEDAAVIEGVIKRLMIDGA